MRLYDYCESQDKQEKGSSCYLGDAVFYVKRINTPDFHKEIEQIKKELYGFAPKEIDNNLVYANWLVEYGVTGWEGVLNTDDNILRYSHKNASKVFLNPEYYLSLNMLLINHAGDYSNYLHDEVEQDIENIKKS